MGRGKISIQFQRASAFGDALCGALGQYLEMPQKQMGTRMLGGRRQRFGHFRFCRRKDAVGASPITPTTRSAIADATSASTLSGSADSA
jgi:hypothetical protein